MNNETLEAAFKKAIKAYWSDDELQEDTLKPQKYDKKYFDDREKEYLGDKEEDDED